MAVLVRRGRERERGAEMKAWPVVGEWRGPDWCWIRRGRLGGLGGEVIFGWNDVGDVCGEVEGCWRMGCGWDG